MTGEGVAQIIVASATFVTALGGVLVSLNNSRKADRNAAKLDDNTRLTQATADKVEDVHSVVAPNDGPSGH